MQEALEENMTEWVLPGRGAELTLVLAVGSNAAPAQLAGKFTLDHFPHGVVIPVLRCILPDFDVVYAPAITSYGSCPGEALHDPASLQGVRTDISFTIGGHGRIALCTVATTVLLHCALSFLKNAVKSQLVCLSMSCSTVH